MAEGIVWKGLADFEKSIEEIVIKADAASKTAVTKGGHLIQSKAVKQFQGTHKRGMPHVGGPHPNTVSGTLKRSIHVGDIHRVGVAAWQSTTGPSAIYGRRIELGMDGKGAYPYLEPGFEEAKEQLPDIFRSAWGEAVRR